LGEVVVGLDGARGEVDDALDLLRSGLALRHQLGEVRALHVVGVDQLALGDHRLDAAAGEQARDAAVRVDAGLPEDLGQQPPEPVLRRRVERVSVAVELEGDLRRVAGDALGDQLALDAATALEDAQPAAGGEPGDGALVAAELDLALEVDVEAAASLTDADRPVVVVADVGAGVAVRRAAGAAGRIVEVETGAG